MTKTNDFLRPGRLRTVALTIGALVALALAVPQGLHQHVGQDFHVFWQAGRNFVTGAPLYHGDLPGARPLKYPPFAALVFAPLGLFSLQVAAVLVSLLNLVLWVVAVFLTRDIIARTFPDRNRSGIPLTLAVVLTAQFFLDNFHHVQMNEVTFVLVLLGIRAYLRGQDMRAAGSIVVATAIKITPIFFAAWLVLRGRRRTALAVVPFALACVLVPMVLRGPANGVSELKEYYHTFLEGHQHGQIDSYTGGQNIAALIRRMTRPLADTTRGSFQYFPTSERTAQAAYRALWVTVMLAFLATLLALRIRRAPLLAYELSMVSLTALLLSPITFTTHLVALLFVFTTALSVRVKTLHAGGRLLAVLVCIGMAATGLSGRDLVGNTVYVNVGGYSVPAWTMIILLVAMLSLAWREPSREA